MDSTMAKKIRMARTFARTAAKSMEKRLVENAVHLQDNPYVIIPDYDDNYSKKYFEKIRKTIEKVHRFKDDSRKLEKLSNKKSLDGALAGTLLIAHSKKAPYLAVAKYPFGNITYAQRGKADKEKLIAVQHFDDPLLRLLGIKDIAMKKGLHIYSWENGYISTGNVANPPSDFIKFVIKKIGLPFDQSVITCGDLDKKIVEKKQFIDKNYLRIEWKSANLTIGICQNCAKSENTLFAITKYLLENDISEDFEIDVVGHVVKKSDKASAHETSYVNEYLSGGLSDIDFIKKNLKDRKASIVESEEKMFILDGKSYGSDVDSFIQALNPNKYEKMGLEFILNRIQETIVLNDVTPNKVLEIYWKKHGLDAIKSIIDDEKVADNFFSLPDTPSEILEVISKYKDRNEILAKLPGYNNLPPLAEFADHIAKTYKIYGKNKVLSELKKKPNTSKAKSISYAFLLVFEKGKDEKWKYSDVEIEYGQFLKEYAEKLLNAESKKYHKALQELLTASGSSINIDSHISK